LGLREGTDGIAMDSHRRRSDFASPDGFRAYTRSAASGRARAVTQFPLPRPRGHPGDTPRRPAFGGRLAISPEGRKLLVPLSLADTAAIVGTRTRRVSYVATGSHPYGAASPRNARAGLVSTQAAGP